MEYPEAINLMHRARLHRPALVYLYGRYWVFSRTNVLGTGITIPKALEDAGLLPEKERAEVVQFSAIGSDVLRGDIPVCVARSHNMALRIANALNDYTSNERGF
jgi:hypothetical protein